MTKIEELKKLFNYAESQDAQKIEKVNYNNFKPTEFEGEDDTPEVNLPEKLTKNQERQFAKVYSFIDMNKHRRLANDKITIMPIPTTNKTLISVCGDKMGVSRLIKFMSEIGLIKVYDDTYGFGHRFAEDNKARTYKYYNKNEKIILQFIKDNNINKIIKLNYNNKNNNYNTLCNSFAFDKKGVIFSSKLHLIKPDNMTNGEFENFLMKCLYENYPQLKKYQLIADEINNTYYKDDISRQISFKPKFTWGRKGKGNWVNKIGIRATNALVSAKKEIGPNDPTWQLHKDVLLDEMNLTMHKDVKSSVPRLTYALNTCEWKDDNFDFYEEIYNKLNEDNKFDESNRAAVKEFHMRSYFDTDKMIAGHLKSYFAEKGVELLDNEKEFIDTEMKKLKQATLEAEGGKLYDSEIFFHESCAYLMVTKKLLELGFDVWQVYDEWNTNNPFNFKEDEYNKFMNDLIEQTVLEYIKELLLINNYKRNYNNNNNNNKINKNNLYNTLCNSFEEDVNPIENLRLFLES